MTGCWEAAASASRAVAAGGSPPLGVGLALVDAAREAVRVPRRRYRRAAARQAPVAAAAGLVAVDRIPPAVELTRHLVAAAEAGHLRVPDASLISSTRVAGWTVAETARCLGTTPESVRALRSRAERRLIATAA